MTSIRELREKVQGPRRAYDTFYGRVVMRRFSVFVTFFLSKVGLSPSVATLLSVLSGVWGAIRVGQGHIVEGLFWVNGWYLLDHVDGELARLTGRLSATGLFFDTIANAIVPPLAFFALGVALAERSYGVFFWLGLITAYGFLMMLMISFCEADALLERLRSAGASLRKSAAPEMTAKKHPLPKRFFSALHHYTTFPVFLPLATMAAVLDVFLKSGCLRVLTVSYAAAITVVWPLVLAKTVLAKKTDRKYAEWTVA